MFFGLTNSPATFQSMMNTVFTDLIKTGKVFIYMDDILIATETLKEHCRFVRLVLKRLQDNHLFLKIEKCNFEQPSVDYLGLILTADAISMDPKKTDTIQTWPAPTHLKEVRSFLGFAGFYRHFIHHFSHVTRSLNNLTKKDIQWSWTSEHQHAFENLKQQF